ncbi:hypothetical protein [Desulfotruncus arcticus]|uniref:hypothetical protein n=1 Tax=Desulfotruncus arcticus TaxID=341036 RepID=UPI001041EF35|nr:hypothetical protein [Desulfotruncus arcticus]
MKEKENQPERPRDGRKTEQCNRKRNYHSQSTFQRNNSAVLATGGLLRWFLDALNSDIIERSVSRYATLFTLPPLKWSVLK